MISINGFLSIKNCDFQINRIINIIYFESHDRYIFINERLRIEKKQQFLSRRKKPFFLPLQYTDKKK